MFELPPPLYQTSQGKAYFANSLDLLKRLPESSLDLVITSPPFALTTKKAYGNESQKDYSNWLCQFGKEIKRVLKDTGSFVLDLGGSYQKGFPVRSLYQFRVLIQLCDEIGFHLAQEFYWFNPSKLPTPVEWVNVQKIRVKDSVNPIWWLSKIPRPFVNIDPVKVPYSKSMLDKIKVAETFTKTKKPSGHIITKTMYKDNGGAIPANLLTIANTESNSSYLRLCKEYGIKPHPARFPAALPEFFIKMLTNPGDLVCDIFAGSNTTGSVAEKLGRKWISMEFEKEYLIGSALRFLSEKSVSEIQETIKILRDGGEVSIF